MSNKNKIEDFFNIDEKNGLSLKDGIKLDEDTKRDILANILKAEMKMVENFTNDNEESGDFLSSLKSS